VSSWMTCLPMNDRLCVILDDVSTYEREGNVSSWMTCLPMNDGNVASWMTCLPMNDGNVSSWMTCLPMNYFFNELALKKKAIIQSTFGLSTKKDITIISSKSTLFFPCYR
jgi:hypothetical protein